MISGYRVWNGGGGGVPDPAFPLHFCKNPASHFLFIWISHTQCPMSANPASQEQSSPESHIVFSEISDPENTLPDPGGRLVAYSKNGNPTCKWVKVTCPKNAIM